MPPLYHRGDKCQVLVCAPVPLVNWLRAHSRNWINPQIPNYVESKNPHSKTSQTQHMNKSSDWNNQATIRAIVKGIRMNYSWLDYGRIWHQNFIKKNERCQHVTSWTCKHSDLDRLCQKNSPLQSVPLILPSFGYGTRQISMTHLLL